MQTMKRTICSFLIVSLHIVSWVSAESRPFAPYVVSHQQDTDQVLLSPQAAFDTRQALVSMEDVNRNEETFNGLSRLGSRPPNCEHQCGGCRPCTAIQVPTNSEVLGVKYANYEPEGWKCKCGTSFFSP